MDNHGIEIDPLFCFPDDFKVLEGTDINITWDICHYSNTLANMMDVLSGKQHRKYYPNIQNAKIEDFTKLNSRISHWHFSAFKGIADPKTGSKCTEGVLPIDSTLGENFYKKCLRLVEGNSSTKRKITLEIQEENYVQRTTVKKMIKWINLIAN
ncbi:MAG: hypothetical protein L3J08_09630 [Flavobacteriaceae bacterium]|nr:hypothetical protein [Flavobacteriaceae bacterium]